MNRNRLKKNLKNIVDEERHLRFVRDEETSLYVPYENEDELRLMSDHGEMYKIAFGYIDDISGEYVEESFTESYYDPDCLMFNDQDYYHRIECFVTYPLYTNSAYTLNNEGSEGTRLFRWFTMFELKCDGRVPLGYKSSDRGMIMADITE